MNRVLDIFYRFITQFFLIACFAGSFLLKKKQEHSQKIAAFPYSPLGWPGGNERIANWKKYFEKENISFDVFWASDEKEYNAFLNSTSTLKYIYYFKVLYRRVKIIPKLKHYDVIWVQRSFIPSYPYKHAYFEKLIAKIHPNLIMDYYDADHVANYNLIIEAVKCANKVSVSTDYLKNFYSSFNPNVFQFNMTIDHTLYSFSKKDKSEKIKIGWMGNEGNLPHLLQLKEVFKTIEKKYPHAEFHFVCREKKDFDLERLTYSSFNDIEFNYFKWLSSIDIGLAPYLDHSEIQKAKSPMKTLEFLSSGIPLIASSYGAFPGMNHREHFMLANTIDDWKNNLSELIENKALRNSLSENGRLFMISNHTYEINFAPLKSIFFIKN